MPIELREYQQRAVAETRQAIASGKKKVVVVSPTGSGKSVIIAEIFSLAVSKGSKCLFLVHRRNLVNQIKETLEQFGLTVGVIMSGIESETKADCQVATIQTYARRLNLIELEENRFYIDADIVVIDEAHRSLGKQYMDVLSLYQDKVILGFTATPCRADGRGLGKIYDCIVDVIGVKELTEKGFLAPARYFVPSDIDLAGIKIQAGDYKIKDLDERVNTPKLVGDVVSNWLKYAEGRQTIVFCINVKHSKHICQEFINHGINAEHLDARSSDEEREAAFKRMENGDITILTNVALYQEGMDCPDISCVVMARPTKSLGLMRQCCGRGLRPKSYGGDCMILDHGGVIEEHGFLDEEICWSLDGKDKAWKKPKREKKEKRPVKCSACNLVFIGGNVCPDCGSQVISFGKKVETIDADLQEVNGKKSTLADKRVYLGMLKWYVKYHNKNPRMVNAKFRSKFGVWPHHTIKHVDPIQPDQAFLNMMKHDMIAYAKRKKKSEYYRVPGGQLFRRD